MKNRKGFTLVELLAVIVVLAIIMIIAIPSVLSAMDNAKKSALVVEARKVLNQAITTVQADSLVGAQIKDCYTLSDLKIETGGKYQGSVKVNRTTNTYTVYLWDGAAFAVEGKTSSELNTISSSVTNATTAPAKITTCGE